jgi:nitrite reductase (NADH) small subunit
MSLDTMEEVTVEENVGPLERIPVGEGRTFRVRGREIAVFRLRDGSVHAVQANCPHRSGLLADGLTGMGRVVCPLHGFAFELATGEPVRNACERLRTYPVRLMSEREVVIRIESEQAGTL